MSSGRIGCELAVVAILCVISIFLFPVARGPYTAIHGPVTTLQSARNAVRVRIGMLAASLGISALLRGCLVALSAMTFHRAHFYSDSGFASASILRC